MNDPAPVPHLSAEQFRTLGHAAIDWIADYWERAGSLPVRSGAKPGDVRRALPPSPPLTGLGDNPGAWSAVFSDLDNVIVPALTHWQSPSFFAYFPCNGSAPAVIGDLLSTGLGVQGMLWATSPACTELEEVVLDWLAQMLNLPSSFRLGKGGGVIQGTASEAAIVALVAARHRAIARGASAESLVLYASAQAHSSIVKAAMIAGLARDASDRTHIRLVVTDAHGAMDTAALAATIDTDRAAGRTPFFVCATVGSTATGAVDSILDCAHAAPEAWLHIDAAYAGSACICPEHRPLLSGIERAHSFCFNPHKWLLTSFDCCAMWITDPKALISAMSITPEYLRNAGTDSGAVTDYRDWQLPLGRRFRALKLWLVIRHYGVEGLQAYIRHHVHLASLAESLVRSDDRFEIPVPRSLGLLCFRLRAGDDATRALMERVNATGKALFSHAILPDGRYVIRWALGATSVQETHVRAAWALLSE